MSISWFRFKIVATHRDALVGAAQFMVVLDIVNGAPGRPSGWWNRASTRDESATRANERREWDSNPR
jgi:hypothetical protein